nr:tyrosine-type recombinase/integrase [Desulfofundulus thermobenzoicus]
MDGFKSHLEATDRKSSIRVYLGDARRFCEWIARKYGSFNAQGVSPLDIIEYRAYLQERGGRKGSGAAPATVNKVLVSLKVFFDWLKKQGEIRDNPAEDIKQVALAAPPSPKWLNRSEQAALIHAVREGGNSRDEAIIGLMLHAGLRVSEVCGLKREDIKISDRSGFVAITGKGNKYREVPLNKTIRKTLARWLEENPRGPLFPNRQGKAITTRSVHKLVAEYAYRAKLKNVTPHTLRHTFCKNLIDMKVPIDQVAMLAGHSSLDITKRYTVPSREDLQEAVDRTAWE